MNVRSVAWVAWVACSVVFWVSTRTPTLALAIPLNGCSGPDPGAVTFRERSRGAAGSSGTIADPGATGVDPTTTDGNDAGPGVDAAPGVADPVFGTSAFSVGNPGPGAPAKAANGAHAGDASGKDCMTASCHQGKWAFGGTLYADAAGTSRVVGAEVRVTGSDGSTVAKAFSDQDGNFWITYVAPLPAGSRVGVRNGSKIMNMAGAVGPNEAGCNQAGSCHGGGAGKVYLK